jgi:hypothetical protein
MDIARSIHISIAEDHGCEPRRNMAQIDKGDGRLGDVEEKVEAAPRIDNSNVADSCAFFAVLEWESFVWLRYPERMAIAGTLTRQLTSINSTKYL